MRPQTSINNSRTTPSLLSLFLILSILSVSETPLNAKESPLKAKQGEVIYLTFNLGPEARAPVGRFLNQPIPIFKTSDGFGALIGIDLEQPPGRRPFEITWKRGEKTEVRRYAIQVLSASFGEQSMTLPEAMVNPDSLALARIEKEKESILATFGQSAGEKLWEGAFLVPTEGKPSGAFGRRRILNGQPRNPHSGEDISAPLGNPVLATNGGKVVLVGDRYFDGRSVVIDHGLGLFSMYFHLSDVSVREGERVARGQRIGAVGQSGRATGPHLHWGTRLNGARVNPFSLVEKKLN